jgi:hypothetical protein
MVVNQPNRTLCFVVAPANLCLTCTPHLTRVKYRTQLQANNQHFSPVFSTKLSYQLVSRHTEFTGQNKGPGGVSKHTVKLTRVEKHVEARAKNNAFDNSFLSYRARDCVFFH